MRSGPDQRHLIHLAKQKAVSMLALLRQFSNSNKLHLSNSNNIHRIRILSKSNKYVGFFSNIRSPTVFPKPQHRSATYEAQRQDEPTKAGIPASMQPSMIS